MHRKIPDLAAYMAGLQSITPPSSTASPNDEQPSTPWIHREIVPLKTRLERLLQEIPDPIKQAGISIPALTERLKGRCYGRAHPGEVGTALRELGWRRVRCWRQDQDGFRAFWHPPVPNTERGS